jgi:TctA family transporter
VFFTRPISLVFMIGTVLVLAAVIAPAARTRREAP